MADYDYRRTGPEDTFITSVGVVLRLKQPSTWTLTAVNRQMDETEPKPPVIMNDNKGREEPNEADPAYIKAVESHYVRRLERLYEVTIATGTEIVSVPEGVPALDDPAWVERLTAFGVEVPASPTLRYAAWVKHVAVPGTEEWLALQNPLLRRVGTPEEDVAAAAATFRGNAERGTDPDGSGAEVGADGD